MIGCQFSSIGEISSIWCRLLIGIAIEIIRCIDYTAGLQSVDTNSFLFYARILQISTLKFYFWLNMSLISLYFSSLYIIV